MQLFIVFSILILCQEIVELVYCIFGDVLVLLEQVCECWFCNLNKENFSKVLVCGWIVLLVMIFDDSYKVMQFVVFDYFVVYVDQCVN